MYKNESKNHPDNLVKDVITGSSIAMFVMSLLIVFLVICNVGTYCYAYRSAKTVAETEAEETISAMKVEYETRISVLEDDFVMGMVEEDMLVNPHELTKTQLKAFIEDMQVTLDAFTAFNLDEQNPVAYSDLKAQYDEAVTALENGDYLYPYSDEDFILACNLVMREQGANVCEDESQQLVLVVALNRKANNGINGTLTNPTSLDIIQEPGQYGSGYSYNMTLDGITDKVKENVRKVFEGEVTAPANVLFQAGFEQGTGIYKKIWNPAPFNNWTYFCYGNLAS